MRATAPALAFLALLSLAPAAAPRAAAEDAAPAPDPDETRGYVGYTPAIAERLTPEDRKSLGVKAAHGLVVVRLLRGGPAEKAGLAVGDVLVRINGKAVPDTTGIDAKSDEAAEKYMKDAFGPITRSVKPGDVVEMVVDRAGTTVTLKAVAVDKATSDALREAAIVDEMAGTVPSPQGQGAPSPLAQDFEVLEGDQTRPAGFLSVTGLWEVRKEEGKPENHVLRQDNDMGESVALLLVTGDGRAYGDVTASVRLAFVGGERSVSGGIVLRAQDRKNYCVVRVDGVTKDLRVVVVKDGAATVVAKTEAGSPKLKTWHTLEVTAKGGTVTGVFDGATRVEAKDLEGAAGWCGLWTLGDAETVFDDLRLTPAK